MKTQKPKHRETYWISHQALTQLEYWGNRDKHRKTMQNHGKSVRQNKEQNKMTQKINKHRRSNEKPWYRPCACLAFLWLWRRRQQLFRIEPTSRGGQSGQFAWAPIVKGQWQANVSSFRGWRLRLRPPGKEFKKHVISKSRWLNNVGPRFRTDSLEFLRKSSWETFQSQLSWF